MLHQWIRITARIVLASYILHITGISAAADFAGSVSSGTTFDSGVMQQYIPGGALDTTLDNKGLGEGKDIAPGSADARAQQSTYNSYYSNPSSATGASFSNYSVGVFIDSSYNTRAKYDLKNDPVFGSSCLEHDAEGQCIKWSLSKDIFVNSYPDCTETVTVTGGGDPDTYPECTGPTVEKSVKKYQYTYNLYPEMELHPNSDCTSLSKTLSGNQVYASCKRYIGANTAIIDKLSLMQNNITTSEDWTTIVEKTEIRYPDDAWDCSNFWMCETLPYENAPPVPGYTVRDPGYPASDPQTLNQSVFLRAGETIKITIAAYDGGQASCDCWLGSHTVILDSELNIGKFNESSLDCEKTSTSKSFNYDATHTGLYVIKVWANGGCRPVTSVKVEKFGTIYSIGASTEPVGMADSIANCVLTETRAYNNSWNSYTEAINTGTIESATIPATTGDTRVCQRYAGGNENYDMCLQSVQLSMDGGLTNLSVTTETLNNTFTENACVLNLNTYIVPCTCGDYKYDGICLSIADGGEPECGRDITYEYAYDGNFANDVICSPTTTDSWITSVQRDFLYNWNGEATFECEPENPPACQTYIDQGCYLYAQQCVDADCENTKYTFRCPAANSGAPTTSTVSYSCSGTTVKCIGSECKDISYENNTDLAAAATAGEIIKNMQFDSKENEIFPGEAQECQWSPESCCGANTGGLSIMDYVAAFKAAKTGYEMAYAYATTTTTTVATTTGSMAITTTTTTTANATTVTTSYLVGEEIVTTTTTYTANAAAGQCGVSTAYTTGSTAGTAVSSAAANVMYAVAWIAVIYTIGSFIYNLIAACDQSDMETGSKLGFKLCHKVGTYCDKKWPTGNCMTKQQVHCCFNSILARVIHEQGREQLGIGWGDPEAPNCRGFTVEEISRLDFSAMDLSEYMQYVELKTTREDIKATTSTCPDGATLSGTTCSVPVTYVCPLEATNLSGTTCSTPAVFTCPDGATLSGSTCSVPAVAGACNSGWTLDGTTCKQPATPVCNSGWTLDGTTCKQPATPVCGTGWTLNGTMCEQPYDPSIKDRNRDNSEALGTNIQNSSGY